MHTPYLQAYKCYECNEMTFNYSNTIDNIPSSITDDCKIVTAERSCSVRIGWFHDGSNEEYYNATLDSPLDSVVTKIEPKLIA